MNKEFWDRQASLPGLRSVMDPNDHVGRKNAYIDCLHKTVLRRYGAFRPTDSVLDFGCGFGRISLWLSRTVASIHAVDANGPMVRRTADEVKRSGARNVCVLPYDGLRLPFGTGVFSKLTCVWVLQHILDEAELTAVLAELSRVVRTGGKLLFIERLADEPDEPWLPRNVILRRKTGEYERLFEQSGLRCVDVVPVQDASPIWRSRYVDRVVMSRWFPPASRPMVAALDIALKRIGALRGWGDYLFGCLKR